MSAVTDLITLDEARDFLQKATAQTGADDILEELVTRASLVIQRDLDLNVVPDEVAAYTFGWDGSTCIDLAPYVARSVSAVTLDAGDSGETDLTAGQWRLSPEPARNSVYPKLELDYTVINGYSGNFTGKRRVTVAAQWGYETVPDELKQAACLTVTAWYRGRVAGFSSQYEDADGGFVARTQKLPLEAFQILADFRRYAY